MIWRKKAGDVTPYPSLQEQLRAKLQSQSSGARHAARSAQRRHRNHSSWSKADLG